MEKLTKSSLLFLHILYVIYQTVSYYSGLFGIDCCECPTDIPTEIVQKDEKTFLKFSFPAPEINRERPHVLDIALFCQDYLQYAVLPRQSFLRPYQYGHLEHEMCCPLYICDVSEKQVDGQDFFIFSVLWIDNKSAYKLYQSEEEFFAKKGAVDHDEIIPKF